MNFQTPKPMTSTRELLIEYGQHKPDCEMSDSRNTMDRDWETHGLIILVINPRAIEYSQSRS